MWSTIREIAETILLTVLIFLLVRSVVQNYKVDGRSMEPTLEGGQLLLVNKAAYWRLNDNPLGHILPTGAEASTSSPKKEPVFVFGPPKRGDVIVFKFPRDTTRPFIKRVMGLPGEVIEIKDGKVHVNGKPLDEPYLSDLPNYRVDAEVVPPDSYFVLGDNRNFSSDSHIWGMVPLENIIGKAWVRYWPPSDWTFLGFLGSATPQAESPPIDFPIRGTGLSRPVASSL